MKTRSSGWAIALFAVLCSPETTLGQDPALVGSFRPYLFVLLAFAAAWVLVGAWIFRIGRKVDRLALRMEAGE